ncbi:TMEM175 family protein [Methylosinus sporium]
MQDDKETTRIEIFSDGAFAIIITLLVLEIKAPGHEVVSEKGLAYSACKGLARLSGLLYQLRHHPRHLGSSPLDVQPIRRGERPRYSGKADPWFTQVKWPLLAPLGRSGPRTRNCDASQAFYECSLMTHRRPKI